MKRSRRWLWTLCLIAIWAGAVKPCQGAGILRISPSGDSVMAENQIVLEFDRPMVPFGGPSRQPIPIDIRPAVDCQWQWIAPETLSCRLPADRPFKKATAYEIRLTSSLTALDSTALDPPFSHRFVTERPRVNAAWLSDWQGPGFPVLEVTFNQPVYRDSVLQTLAFVTEKGALHPPAVEPHPEDANPERFSPGDADRRNPARDLWWVYPAEPLAPNQKVRLKIEKGLRSWEGDVPGTAMPAVTTFRTFSDFRFMGLRCFDPGGKSMDIPTENAMNTASLCDPLKSVFLLFSAPVTTDALKRHSRFSPELVTSDPSVDPWASVYVPDAVTEDNLDHEPFAVRVPSRLKADTRYQVSFDTRHFTDRFGRGLTGPSEAVFQTDHRSPNLVLTHPFSVLEKGADTDTPAVVTNLKRLVIDYRKVFSGGSESGARRTISIARVPDIAFATPLGIRQMLEGRSGAVRGSVAADPPVSEPENSQSFFAQVTPFHVHVKAGHFNLLVWVTDLATGRPVERASVTCYQGAAEGLSLKGENYRTARTDAHGVARLPGLATLDPSLTLLHGYRADTPRLFVRLEKDGDMALLPLTDDFSVDTYRASREQVFSRPMPQNGHLMAWGFTPQGIYRPGDRVDYKALVRGHDNLSPVPAPAAPYTLTVTDPKGEEIHTEKAITLSAFGGTNGSLRLPATATAGWYQIRMRAPFSNQTLEAGRFLVTDFTPAPFRVLTEIKGTKAHPNATVTVDTRALLHAGGPFSNASGRITATLKRVPFEPGSPRTVGYVFEGDETEPPGEAPLFDAEFTLDGKGETSHRFEVRDGPILWGRIEVESAVSDDRGKRIAGRSLIDYAGRDRFVGLRHDGWTLTKGEPATLGVWVVDAGANPVPTASVVVVVERNVTRAVRVKGAGNAYITRYTHEWVPEWETTVATGPDPVEVRFSPKSAGSYRIRGITTDGSGRRVSAMIERWSVGKGQVLWQEPPDNSLEIVPERRAYEAGQTVSCLVKNPFPGAMALVTVERYGVLRSWVETFDTATPIIRFPVQEGDAPGVFLSVVVMSPRQAPPQPMETVDLGKPSFKMGYAPITVRRTATSLPVTVSTDRPTARPGERVTVTLSAESTRDHEPVEFTVAVLDEAILELLHDGRSYFDPEEGFNRLDGLDLENYNLLQGLIGRIRFEKKGAADGGDGGAGIRLRDASATLAYWNPSITADAAGKATFSFTAPDNLTGWRILAAAVTPGSRMGLGEGRVAVNRPTEIRAIVPNQVLEGDRFEAAFSILNRTETPRTLAVSIEARGAVEAAGSHRQSVLAPPFERVRLPLEMTASGTGAIDLVATAGDGMDRDGLKHQVPVKKAWTLKERALYGQMDAAGKIEIPIAFPEDMRTDAGDLTVTVHPSPLGDLAGAFTAMRDYPHTCWEQRLSRAVAAAVFLDMKTGNTGRFSWPSAKAEIQETLEKAADFQTPGGGMGFYTSRPENEHPFLSAYTALAFSWLESKGFSPPPAVSEKLTAHLENLLRQKSPNSALSERSMASLRAMILSALAEKGAVPRDDLERLAPYLDPMDTFGLCLFLRAAWRTPEAGSLAEEALSRITSRFDWTEGGLTIKEAAWNTDFGMFDSPHRTAGALLWALSAAPEKGRSPLLNRDMSRLARSLHLSRQPSGHWGSTQTTAFALKGLESFAEKGRRTSEPGHAKMRLSLDSTRLGAWNRSEKGAVPLKWTGPIRGEDRGKTRRLLMEKEGNAPLYYEIRLRYTEAGLPDTGFENGIGVNRTYFVKAGGAWRALSPGDRLAVGEEVTVVMDVLVPALRHFVAVTDRLPGCLEPVNRELATAVQKTDTAAPWMTGDEAPGPLERGIWYFYHQELGHEEARFYSETLPAGVYRLTYGAQVIAPGRFTALPARAEAMYDPLVSGESAARILEVAAP